MKNYFIATIILLLAFNTYAGFWSALVACVKNPCGCGRENDVIERWNGQEFNRGKSKYLCPPWGLEASRSDNTCVISKPYPFSAFPVGMDDLMEVAAQGVGLVAGINLLQKVTSWTTHCAENTFESTYLEPKIRVRHQTCNLFACWTQSTVIKKNGGCVVWPGPYAYPTLRICARMAMPEQIEPSLDPSKPNRVFPADPGYTFRKHLNFEGAEIEDEAAIGDDGQPIYLDRPKFCAYKDPSIFTNALWDPFDYNPTTQPMHYGSGVHPIVEVLIFLIESTTGGVASIGELLGDLLGLGKFSKSVISFIGDVIKYIGSGIKALLEAVGQFNLIVGSYKFGCVNVPLGPFPPPYCPRLVKHVPTAVLQAICPIGSSNQPIKSSQDFMCVVSEPSIINNAVSNSLRIGFDRLVPLCGPNVNPLTTDKCVEILNSPTGDSAAGLHIALVRKDKIPACGAGVGGPCVSTKIPIGLKGARVVYATKIGNSSYTNSTYIEEENKEKAPGVAMPDCASKSPDDLKCQIIWGVNLGDYTDVSLVFPQIETLNAITRLSTVAQINDLNTAARRFNVSIVREEYTDPTNLFVQTPEQICVEEEGEIIGCIDRQPVPQPTVYECEPGSIIPCTNDFYTPKMIAKIQVGSNSTSALVAANTVHGGAIFDGKINLAGYNFESFVADKQFASKPFSGPNSFNSSSIHGKYKDNIPPYDHEGKEQASQYLTGLEYVNDQYIHGGKYICIAAPENDKCPTNNKLCVLSHLKNKEIISCRAFAHAEEKFGGLRLCETNEGSCTLKESIPGKFGGNGIKIYECIKDDMRSMCYQSASNTPVCVRSIERNDRYIPAASEGDILADDKFYDYAGNAVVTDLTNPNAVNEKFNRDLYSLRDKTPLEQGLCVPIPQPKCAAKNEKNAKWPETIVGEVAKGICAAGYNIDDTNKLDRYCISDPDRYIVAFQDLPAGVECKGGEVIFDFTSDFSTAFIRQQTGDASAGDDKFGLLIVGTQNYDKLKEDYPGSTATVYNNISMNIRINDLNNIEYFRFKEIIFKNSLVIKVNGKEIYNVDKAGGVGITPTTVNDINLVTHFQQGTNKLEIRLGSEVTRVIYYNLEYKFK